MAMPTNPNRRKLLIVALGVCFLVFLLVLNILNAFNSPQLPHPGNLEQIFMFTGLSIVAFLLFVVILVLLVRNMLKLYADQRSRVMGARLRTRMLWGAVLVSFLPIAFMFAFSYLLMNRAVDRWFSQPVTQMRDDSNRMALALAQYTTANARVEADSIASSLPETTAAPERKSATPAQAAGRNRGRKPRHASAHPASPQATQDGVPASRQNREAINRVLRQHEITLQNGFAIVYREGRAVAAFHMPQRDGATAEVKPWLPEPATDEDGATANAHAPVSPPPTNPTDAAILAAAQRSDSPVFSLGQM